MDILTAILVMTLGFWMYSFAVIFARVRNLILLREGQSEWVRKWVKSGEKP